MSEDTIGRAVARTEDKVRAVAERLQRMEADVTTLRTDIVARLDQIESTINEIRAALSRERP